MYDRPPLIANPWKRWLAGFAFWTVVGLFFATKSSIQGEPAGPMEVFERSMVQWYLWGLLAALVVRIDRRLPAPPEALLQRALWHLPLSPVIVFLHICGTVAASALLNGQALSFGTLEAAVANAARGGLHWQMLVYWMIVGVYYAYDYHVRLQQRHLRNSELERLLAESRLHNLRSQLHPHFLFNALNAISSHVEREPRLARRMLEQLGDLLRLSLDHAEDQEISLDEEIAFLERYLSIQKARFEERLEVRFDVSSDARQGLVPTFLLQPLVENAVQHGVAPRSVPGAVSIRAWRDNGSLRLRVADDGPGLPPGWKLEDAAGVGLANTLERLRRHYGDTAAFTIAGPANSGVQVEISLPYHEHSNGHR
ncbi:MAG: histidine kinase [Bryobacterales bacterium]|nr:histidine kinase [Bryobacterales bacterium]